MLKFVFFLNYCIIYYQVSTQLIVLLSEKNQNSAEV